MNFRTCPVFFCRADKIRFIANCLVFSSRSKQNTLRVRKKIEIENPEIEAAQQMVVSLTVAKLPDRFDISDRAIPGIASGSLTSVGSILESGKS